MTARRETDRGGVRALIDCFGRICPAILTFPSRPARLVINRSRSLLICSSAVGRQDWAMIPHDSAFESPRRRQRRPRGIRPAVDRLESRTLPATFVVNSLLDAPDAHPGDGVARTADGLTTLRAAVMEANALPGSDIVVLPAGTYRF